MLADLTEKLDFLKSQYAVAEQRYETITQSLIDATKEEMAIDE